MTARYLNPRSIGTVLGAVGIGVLAWPVPEVSPSPGLDPSFIAGLHMAGASGMDVGVEIVSTYGPLGFLSFPQPVYGVTTAFAVVHTAAIVFPLVWILLHRSAAVLPFWAAMLLSYAGAQAIRGFGVPEMALALTGILAILALERAAHGHRLPVWAVIGAGFLAVIFGLGKLNTGAVVLGTAAATIAAIGGWRHLLVLFGTVVASAVAVWILTGQGVSNVLPFFSTSVATVLGFNAAMGQDGDLSVHWMVAGSGLAMGALIYAVYEPILAWPPRLRIALIIVSVMVAFITFKASFVRWHFHFIFATLVIFSIALLTPRINRRTAMLAIAATFIALLGAFRVDLPTYLDPTPRAALAQVRSLLSNAETADRTRDVLAAAYAVDEAILSRVRGESLHIGPLESAVAYAHQDVVWTPLPVYQDYATYTASLDDLNREFLLSTEGPRFILRGGPVAIDGRNPWFEGPGTIRAMLCRYGEVEVGAQWQLLERGPDRCADPELVSRVETEPGVAVPVPQLSDDDAMMFVAIHGLEPTVIDAAWSFLFKAPEWYITLDETNQYRLVAPTAGQGMVMAVGDSLAYTDPFGFGPALRSISVSPGPRSPVGTPELQLEFWVVRERHAAAMTGRPGREPYSLSGH